MTEQVNETATDKVENQVKIPSDDKYSMLWENVRTVGYALIIALLIRIFLFQPFNIPSGSMIPNLLVGDYLFVAKYEYGLSRHSFPFSPPLFNGRLFGVEPERGDIAVFKLPRDGRTDYIKRVIGLPGDRIQMRHGELYINNKKVKRDFVDEIPGVAGGGFPVTIKRYKETLPSGESYIIHHYRNDSRGDNTQIFVVPEGHFFMMGDNRDNSQDSRFQPEVGYVPYENFVGQAKFIFFSTDGSAGWLRFWKWPSATRWDRIFDGLG